MDLSRPDRAQRLEALAAQYALGTLSPRARRRLVHIARRDPRVAQVLSQWELRLASLASAAPPVTPPPRVWDNIAARLGLASARAGPSRAAFGWWRGLALASSLAAIVLAIALSTLRPEPAGPSLVVVLAGADARPALVATGSGDARTLTFKAVVPLGVASDRALELWALPEGAAPRSLGLIPSSGTGAIRVPAAALDRIPALAVSLEPAGGSPTGAPTGPVLYSGRIERI